MTIQDKVNTYPVANASKGIGNSLIWSILEYDIYTEASLVISYADIFIQVGAVTGSFDFDGMTFTINNGTPYTKSTFKIEATSRATALNIVNMLLSNIGIATNWTTELEFTGANTTVKLRPNSYKYKEKGLPTDSFSNGNITVTGLGYNNADVREGLRYAWSLYEQTLTGDYLQLTKLQSIQPFVNPKTGGPVLVDLDFTDSIRGLLKTTFPYLDSKAFVYDRAIIKKIFAKVGLIEKLDCVTTDSEFENTSVIAVLNAVNQYDAINGMFEYSYDMPEKTGGVKFLNDNHNNLTITNDTNAWLWFYDNILLQNPGANYKIIVYHTFLTASNSAISFNQKEINTGAIVSGYEDKTGVIIIPFGGANMPYAIPSNLAFVQVTVALRDTLTNTDVVVSEFARIPYIKEDCNHYEFYFLSPKGGYDTIRFPYLEEVTQSTEQNEVTLQSFARNYEGYGAGGTVSEAVIIDYLDFINNSGTKQTNTKSSPLFKVRGTKFKASDSDKDYLLNFFASGQRKMRLKGLANYPELSDNLNLGNKLNVANIVIVHSDLVVYKDQGLIEPIFTFRFANNIGSND